MKRLTTRTVAVGIVQRLIMAVLASFVVILLSTPAGATFRGRNGPFAFYANRGEDPTTQLYTIHRNGARLRTLTDIARNDFILHEDWSPDGSLIAYEFDSDATGNQIQLMNTRGADVRDLTGSRTRCETEPSFTPNGRSILFIRAKCNDGRTAEIWSMNLHGRNRHEISETPGLNALDPNVSPNGSLVSFTVVAKAGMLGGALYTVHRDGTHMTKIVPFSRDVGIKSDWSPDGHRIVFTEYLDAQFTGEPAGVTARVATVRPDGSHLHELTHGTSLDNEAVAGSFSPDGRWIVYRFDNFKTDRYSLYRMHPDGTKRTRIVRLKLKARGLDWGAA